MAVEVEVLSPSLRTTRRCNNNPFKFLPTFFLNSHLSPHNLQVLCYHGPLLYEAKCVKSRKDTKSGNPGDFQYFVHYQGWNKNWDEWVDETRILKASSENFDRKEKLFAQHQVTASRA